MTGSSEPKPVSEAEIDASVAAFFGRTPANPSHLATEAFRDAGFSDDLAAQGARMLQSGRYMDFTDAASSLAMFNNTPRVTPTNIQEAAAHYERLAKTVREQ